MTQSSYRTDLPPRIKEKLDILKREIEQIETGALDNIKTSMNEPISFLVQNQTMEDLLSNYERAQSISFVARYENLPDLKKVSIIQHQGRYFLGNMPYIRHILNEYRSIISNESDSVYFQNVHKLCFKMLSQNDPRKGTTINALTTIDVEITEKLIKCIGEHNKAIKFVLRTLELDYIYNGIVQHSDEYFSRRFVEDYTSGELNYILWKHAILLGLIKDLLKPYYIIMNLFSFPKLGPL